MVVWRAGKELGNTKGGLYLVLGCVAASGLFEKRGSVVGCMSCVCLVCVHGSGCQMLWCWLERACGFVSWTFIRLYHLLIVSKP